MCAKIWDEQISPRFQLTTHTRFENFVLSDTKSVDAIYGGRRFILDEAHYNRKEKRLFRATMHVISVCRKASHPIAGLYLLTATPMIESAEEICPLVSWLEVLRAYPLSHHVAECLRYMGTA